MKYIIDIEEKPLCVFDKDTQTYFPRLWRVKGFNSLVFDEDGLSRLEELNSDYINEHFGDLQDTAYQRGLEDAWEAARKVALNSNDGGLSIEKLDEIFDRYTLQQVLKEYTAKQAIAKLKVYEEKQKADEEIKVGDEVEVLNSGNKYLIAWISGTSICGFAHDGVNCRLQPSDVRKTGRHFDIASILKEMQP